MKTRCLLVLWALSAALLPAGAQPARERPLSERSTITVTGNGEAQAAPDVAYVTVGVVTEGKRAQEAAQANAAATQKVVGALRQQGIAEKDLQTNNYMVQPKYENRPGRDPLIIGYQVSNQVRATVRKLGEVGKTIDAALDAGANTVQGVSFDLDKRTAAESEALADAAREARARAETLAQAAGVRLGLVLQIHEGASPRPVPMFAGRLGTAAEAATPIQPGELTVNATVTIVYALEGPGQAATTAGRRAARR